jgi:hypothetical protein
MTSYARILLLALITLASARLLAADTGILTVARPDVYLGVAVVGEERDTVVTRAFVNESDDTVLVTAVRVLGGDGTVRLAANHFNSIVPPGGALDISLVFRPTAVSTYRVIVRAETTTDFDPIMVAYGAGAYSEPTNGLSVIDPVFIGNIPEGTTLQVPLYDALANVGFVPLSIDTMYITGEYAPSYYLETMPSFPHALPSGGTLPVSVIFMASERGVHGARLVIVHADTTTSIPLLGVVGEIDDPFTVRLQARQGAVRDTVLTFRHMNEIPLTVASIDAVQAPFTIVDVDPALPATRGAYEDLRVRVRLTAEASGTFVSPLRLVWRESNGEEHGNSRRVIHARVEPSTGVNDDAAWNAVVRLHPNPARETLSVVVSDVIIAGYALRDLKGRVLRSATVSASDRLSVAVADLPAGGYILSVRSADGREHVHGFVIER